MPLASELSFALDDDITEAETVLYVEDDAYHVIMIIGDLEPGAPGAVALTVAKASPEDLADWLDGFAGCLRREADRLRDPLEREAIDCRP